VGELFPLPECDTSRDAWRTPRALFAALDAEFHFVIDLAADKENHLCQQYRSAGDDALSCDWPIKGWCWLNPPFSRIPEFAAACSAKWARGSSIVMLVPANRCEQGWWHEHVLGVASEIRYPTFRVAFVPPPGVKASSPAFPCCLVVYGAAVRGQPTVASSWTPRLFADQEDAP